jgi:hypothetical protein
MDIPSKPGLRVIEGGRLALEWELFAMILTPSVPIAECEALGRRLDRRAKDRLRLAGGTGVSRVLLGDAAENPGPEDGA